jgi:hypothetical protein
MHRDHLKGAAGFPSDEGAMHTAAQSLLSAILALLPSPTCGIPSKPCSSCSSKARPQHSQTKSPSALSRFLNSCPWPTRLARQEAETTLHLARRSPGSWCSWTGSPWSSEAPFPSRRSPFWQVGPASGGALPGLR